MNYNEIFKFNYKISLQNNVKELIVQIFKAKNHIIKISEVEYEYDFLEIWGSPQIIS